MWMNFIKTSGESVGMDMTCVSNYVHGIINKVGSVLSSKHLLLLLSSFLNKCNIFFIGVLFKFTFEKSMTC